MASAQRLWLGRQLNNAALQRAASAISQLGQELPCSVLGTPFPGFVTVKFEVISGFTLPQVTIPMQGSQYVRIPYQPGEKGWCTSADAQLGNVSGVGSGVPNLTQPPNLAALVFQPIGNKGWFAVPDNMLVMYGFNGVLIWDSTAQNSKVAVTSSGVTVNSNGPVSATVGGASITIDATGVDIVTPSPATGLKINGVPGISTSVVISGHNITTVNGIVTVLT